MKTITNLIKNKPIYLILLISMVATLGSLYYSEVAGYDPCRFCWYQRILMYPIFILSFASIMTSEKFASKLILFLSVPGIFVALYHYLLQKTTLFGEFSTCSKALPCGAENIDWFGFITIPFQALVAFILISLICGLNIWWKGEQK